MCKYLKGTRCTKKNIDVRKRGYLMFCDDFEPRLIVKLYVDNYQVSHVEIDGKKYLITDSDYVKYLKEKGLIEDFAKWLKGQGSEEDG